jgi:hypothetical protein
MEPTHSPLMLSCIILGFSITVLSWKVQSRDFVNKYAPLLRAVRKRYSPREAEWMAFCLCTLTVYTIHTEPVGLLFAGSFTALACGLGLYSISYDAYISYSRQDREQRSHQ